jgi:hypothetical protein
MAMVLSHFAFDVISAAGKGIWSEIPAEYGR